MLERYIKTMWGFSKKRFLITLGISIVVWLISFVIQANMTFGKYLGTFSSGCQVTGYPIDVCTLRGPYISPILIIVLNIFFWFWIIYFLGKLVQKRNT